MPCQIFAPETIPRTNNWNTADLNVYVPLLYVVTECNSLTRAILYSNDVSNTLNFMCTLHDASDKVDLIGRYKFQGTPDKHVKMKRGL